jgi:RNA polymerase sigma-70 factor (ECF subfamily)
MPADYMDLLDQNHASFRFQTTHWSQICDAGESQTPQAEAALQKLCSAYWYPLYAFARRSGQPEEDSKDAVQTFFLELLESKLLLRADPKRGRFRNYLLKCFENSRSNERRNRRRKKAAP